MTYTELAVIGAGPAGLAAAAAAARCGAEVLILDRNPRGGGQLIKQTHLFFGSREQYASCRGIEIASLLEQKVREQRRCTLSLETWALGLYEEGTLLVDKQGKVKTLRAGKFILATGAMENPLAFPGCDLPGVYGAGAVQTLMNVYGVKPGHRALMVGAGNIGLIVAYQLLQAGVEVAAVVEAAPAISGYLVHASKIRRWGVPIETSVTVKEAHGSTSLDGVTLHRLDGHGRPAAGSERRMEVDLLCLAVGLSPLVDLLYQAGCSMVYIPQLGGFVPCRDRYMSTSCPAIYVAGDVAGIGEAGIAMEQGRLAGLTAALDLGYGGGSLLREREEAREALEQLVAGEVSRKVREGMLAVEEKGGGVRC